MEGEEAYEFTWVGKKESKREAEKPIRKTLRPCKEESKNWDNTENLYIEGDNLEVLKLLQESYLNSIKMIYIDPPYNTGGDFIYNDDFKLSRKEYMDESGELDEAGNRLFKNTDTNGRFHSDWCSMMYSRLTLARNLLSDDGVIFISIDDNEQGNLRKICDEIFGEDNYISEMIWKTKFGGGNDSRTIVNESEYILVYCKQKSKVMIFKGDNNYTKYEFEDEYIDVRGRYSLEALYRSSIRYSESLFYPIAAPDGTLLYPNDSNPSSTRHIWRWSKETFEKKKKEGRVEFKKTKNGWRVFSKQYELLNDNNEPRVNPLRQNILDIPGRRGSELLSTMMGYNIEFNNPKPVELIEKLVASSIINGFVCLDFFSGSATTAHAVMQLNAEDGGKRKFIMVQIPEETEAKSEAYKGGYKNICEIAKERIRRAGEKIQEENAHKEGIEHLDTGFRVFKVDSSNMKDVYYSPDAYSQDLLSLMESNIKEDRTDLDLLFGCLLEWGLPLNRAYESKTIEGTTIHIYNDGDLVASFDERISEGVVKEIATMKPLRVVFRDASFKTSAEKINVEEIFKLLSPETSVRVI